MQETKANPSRLSSRLILCFCLSSRLPSPLDQDTNQVLKKSFSVVDRGGDLMGGHERKTKATRAKKTSRQYQTREIGQPGRMNEIPHKYNKKT